MIGASNSFKTALSLLRVRHWVKNLFVFLPAFFAGQILQLEVLIETCIAVVSFCLVSSAVYIVNDIRDIDEDKAHPQKSKRAIASGLIKTEQAVLISVVLVLVSFSLLAMASTSALIVLVGYFVINMLYSFGLKNIVVLDLILIAVGFLLRVYAGGIISDIPVSGWLLIMVFLISIFMGLAKRRDDAMLFKNTQLPIRRNIERYNIRFIDIGMVLVSGILIVAYVMYSISPELENRIDSEYAFMTSFL